MFLFRSLHFPKNNNKYTFLSLIFSFSVGLFLNIGLKTLKQCYYWIKHSTSDSSISMICVKDVNIIGAIYFLRFWGTGEEIKFKLILI